MTWVRAPLIGLPFILVGIVAICHTGCLCPFASHMVAKAVGVHGCEVIAGLLVGRYLDGGGDALVKVPALVITPPQRLGQEGACGGTQGSTTVASWTRLIGRHRRRAISEMSGQS
jgi:hypothetical protein